MTTQEVDSFKIASPGSERIHVLPCFLIVKSSLLFFDNLHCFSVQQSIAAGNVCGPAGQDSLWQWDREGTAGPGVGHCRATLAMALELEWSKRSRCQLAGDERAPVSSNLHPGLGRDWGR